MGLFCLFEIDWLFLCEDFEVDRIIGWIESILSI